MQPATRSQPAVAAGQVPVRRRPCRRHAATGCAVTCRRIAAGHTVPHCRAAESLTLTSAACSAFPAGLQWRRCCSSRRRWLAGTRWSLGTMSHSPAGAPLLPPPAPPLAPLPLATPLRTQALLTPASGRLWNATRTGGWPSCECPLDAAADVTANFAVLVPAPALFCPLICGHSLWVARGCRELGPNTLALGSSCFPDCKNETFQFSAPLASLTGPLEARPGRQQLLVGLGLTGTLPRDWAAPGGLLRSGALHAFCHALSHMRVPAAALDSALWQPPTCPPICPALSSDAIAGAAG